MARLSLGVFIRVTVDENQLTPAQASQLVAVCPVNIYALEGDRVRVQADQEDECILCELCLKVAPPGAVTIRKLYKNELLVSQGNGDAHMDQEFTRVVQ
jgi:NAD-dependent dihydropyrimidine dehydrogenase PreA subunit